MKPNFSYFQIFFKKAGHRLRGVWAILAFRKKGHYSDPSNLDERLVYSMAPQKIPNPRQLKYLPKFLNSRENIWVKILLLIILINVIFLVGRFYKKHLVLSPLFGGRYSEALVGAPKYINPLYNFNRDADSDLSRLVYSSLYKRGQDGKLEPDLVASSEISDDYKTYTFHLKKDIKFTSGDDLTADDVVFTFEAIKNADYNSPLRNIYQGIGIQALDDYTVQFTLGEAYAGFLELLTIGILPQNLWASINPSSASLADLNLKPVGSGPYKFNSLVKNKNGDIKEYILDANEDYFGDGPYIAQLVFKFYPSATEALGALNSKEVDGLNYLPLDLSEKVLAKNSLAWHKLSWPQINALFFGQKNNVLLGDPAIRKALALAVNKDSLVKNALRENAQISNAPIPLNTFVGNIDNRYYFDPSAAMKLLEEDGYVLSSSTKYRVKLAKKKNQADTPLKISLTVLDTADNLAVASELKKYWEDIGVEIEVKTVSADSVVEDVIRSRNFEILLFSYLTGGDPDVYAFWHSSQATANGLNISDYKNSSVDTWLEEGRLSSDQNRRIEKYKNFINQINSDLPAIFLYSPNYLYLQSKSLRGFDSSTIVDPSDRFSLINNWFIKTKKKLKF